MNRIVAILLVALAGACSHLPSIRSDAKERAALWDEAHRALAAEAFSDAHAAFQRLAAEYPAHSEGREAIFYLGAMHLDPRNPGWDPLPAVQRLREYIDFGSSAGTVIHRRPEAMMFLQLAEQLSKPPEQRVAGLQPGTQVEVVRVPQRVAPAEQSQALLTEVATLRRQLAERDEQIRRQREELERIRRTLTPRVP
jgi:TolA-binding protein